MSNAEVKRTLGFWKNFFNDDKSREGRKNSMMLKVYLYENKQKLSTKKTYNEIMEAITLLGNRCVHDTDKCLHNTRRGLKN